MDKTIYLDLELCVGCGACVVACMDQNDIYPEKGQPAFRRIYKVEGGEFPDASIQHLSAGCVHCEDSPCVIGIGELSPFNPVNPSEGRLTFFRINIILVHTGHSTCATAHTKL